MGVKGVSFTEASRREDERARTAGPRPGQLALLYDIYGGLLTENQRRIFQLRHHRDLSLAEIASVERISRQAVFDVLQRSERVLVEAERRLGLLKRYRRQWRLLEDARLRLRRLMTEADPFSCPQVFQDLRQVDRLLERLGRAL